MARTAGHHATRALQKPAERRARFRRASTRCSRIGTATRTAGRAVTLKGWVNRPARRDSIPAVPTVLVVDDSPEILRITRDYLEHAGFSVLTASDGAGALRVARQRAPELVVLDLSMPGMDGLDVARALRRESALPIIMLTARADESDTLVGLE